MQRGEWNKCSGWERRRKRWRTPSLALRQALFQFWLPTATRVSQPCYKAHIPVTCVAHLRKSSVKNIEGGLPKQEDADRHSEAAATAQREVAELRERLALQDAELQASLACTDSLQQDIRWHWKSPLSYRTRGSQ